MSGFAFDGDPNPDSALTAPLHLGAGRFHEYGEVCAELLRKLAGETPQSVEGGVHLLMVVEHPGDIETRLGEFARQLQSDRDPPPSCPLCPARG